MKDSLTNPVRYNKIIVIEAILLTIVIHLLFFYLFSVPSVRHQNIVKENTTVTLLRFAPEDPRAVKIQNYINRYNPGHFSNPNSPIGYASLLTSSGRNVPHLPPLDNKELQIKAVNSHDVFKLPETNIKNIPLPGKRNLLPVKQNSSAQIPYPFAISSSGTVIRLTFSTDEQRMINEFPLSPGVYKLFKPEGSRMLRLALLQSCGRRTLDNLSIRILYQEINKNINCVDGEIFTVFYRASDNPGGQL